MSRKKKNPGGDDAPKFDAVRTRDEPPGRKREPPSLLWAAAAVVLGVGAVAAWLFWPERNYTPVAKPAPPAPKPFVMEDENAVFATYAGSESCKACHAAEFEKWAASNHGMAERLPKGDMDSAAFDPPRSFKHGTQTTDARKTGDAFEIVSLGFGYKRDVYPVQRVIGHDPLRQFLVAGPGGRFQTLEACWDPHKQEWFNVYGDEDRKPGEWGHWTGRGMVWNQMCAGCHNTRVRKNYDAATDGYHTTMAQMTVSCESCHGGMKAHVDWQAKYKGSGQKDPSAVKFTRDQMIETCAPCHSRRAELTGDFKPGDAYFDHYSLTIVDNTDIYFPDGQVRDEDYEFGSFHSSRMFHAGVRCVDCHDPHAAKPLLPGNQLCMRCHTAGGFPNAPVIVPEAHTFHKADSTGSQCVNCHMPQTVYMQRHSRHDHGFTIPDPLLTKQFNIPNACNRCHTDKDAGWALAAVEKTHGDRMNRRTRTRSTTFAKARQGDTSARDELLALLDSDELPHWKASAILLLERWMGEPVVANTVAARLDHADPLVRASAARVLDPPPPDSRAALQKLLDDPVRAVRSAAAWTLREHLDAQSAAGKDLQHMLDLNADQPSGQMQMAQYHFARGTLPEAIKHMETAIRWDPNSPPFHHDLAMMYSVSGNTAMAIEKLQDAIKLAPNEADYHYKLGLAFSESNNLAKATEALEAAVKANPRFGRAWYNLGLAKNSAGKTEEAIRALLKGEEAEPTDAGIPYARATILARIGRKEEAIAAAQRALQIRPDHAEARELIGTLMR
ncbi:MAG: tetratricopeptide repeat protein [Verrucomicrobiaceae bacterium]|nr:tetratricopeptide repeat protein [Verrucomicrobiaceae bacterium]